MNDPDFVAFKNRQRRMWASLTPTATFTTPVAGRLVQFAQVQPGETVLDVGTGTGVVAITAARAGAQVTGLDLTGITGCGPRECPYRPSEHLL